MPKTVKNKRRYAQVALDLDWRSENDVYTYRIPTGMEAIEGSRVRVPFGKGKAQGYIVGIFNKKPAMDIKPIIDADSSPLFFPYQIELARRISTRYWTRLPECLGMMLPPGVRKGVWEGDGAVHHRQQRHSKILVRAAMAENLVKPEHTPDQKQALEILEREHQILLFGVPASGKTEVYMAACESAIAQGGRALVLVPEMTLTPQLVDLFASRFPGQIAVLQSGLTELERSQQWWKVRRGEAQVVIGSRSAVFTPIPELSLICVDEERSPSYQEERHPRYEATWVARQLAELSGAKLILGSSTPSLETYQDVMAGRLAVCRMSHPIQGKKALVELVNMRLEKREGFFSPISRILQGAVESAVRRGEQVVLFLNRKGGRPLHMCRACGQTVCCPRCQVALGEREQPGQLECPYCGYSRETPLACPTCGSREIVGVGIGTQRLELLAHKIWPQAITARLDSDLPGGYDAKIDQIDAFYKGEIDILIGTQVVTRGLDHPNVTVVGIVDADQRLYSPDFRAAEETYDTLVQAAGRAGRGRPAAKVIIQTFNAQHYSLQFAQKADYLGFFVKEMGMRQALGFPPLSEMVLLTFSHRDLTTTADTCQEYARQFIVAARTLEITDFHLDGPLPALPAHLRGYYRWQLTMRGHGLARLQSMVSLGPGWSVDVLG